VAIRLKREDLEVALERAYQLARSDQAPPRVWDERVARIEATPSKTYIAALGAALLAKSTDDRVDALSRTADASDRGYAIRGVGEFLATKKETMGFDLGAPGKWPLNNSPFYRNAARIDRFEHIHSRDRPFYEDLVRYLRELDKLNASQATKALAVFLRRRMAVAQALTARRRELVAASGRLADVVDVARLFVTENPEGGMRGQAFTAGVLDCAYDDVRLRSINDPAPLDVTVWKHGSVYLAVEVKQLLADEGTALAMAEDASDADCDRAMLVALDPSQRALDRTRIRQEALEMHGVLVEVCASVEELVARVASASDLKLPDLANRLQERVLVRLQEHGLLATTVERWATLCEGLAT
jgi:hypothetical protein